MGARGLETRQKTDLLCLSAIENFTHQNEAGTIEGGPYLDSDQIAYSPLSTTLAAKDDMQSVRLAIEELTAPSFDVPVRRLKRRKTK